MKKTFTFVLTLISSMCLLNVVAVEKPTDESDKIFFSKEGGTTRIESTPMMRLFAVATPTVVGECSGEVLTLDVQNYVGDVWVEIIGNNGDVVVTSFSVIDMGFNVVNLSTLQPGKYTVKIMLESNIFVGEFKKIGYGYYK